MSKRVFMFKEEKRERLKCYVTQTEYARMKKYLVVINGSFCVELWYDFALGEKINWFLFTIN